MIFQSATLWCYSCADYCKAVIFVQLACECGSYPKTSIRGVNENPSVRACAPNRSPRLTTVTTARMRTRARSSCTKLLYEVLDVLIHTLSANTRDAWALGGTLARLNRGWREAVDHWRQAYSHELTFSRRDSVDVRCLRQVTRSKVVRLQIRRFNLTSSNLVRMVPQLNHLQKLHLDFMQSSDTLMTDDVMQAVAALPHLTDLRIHWARKLTDWMPRRRRSASCTPRNLEILHLVACHGITSDFIASLTSCHALRKLGLSLSGDNVTDEALISVAAGCRALEVLDLGSNRDGKWTPAGIEAIARSCPRLRVINLDTSLAHDRVLAALAGHTRELAELQVRSRPDALTLTAARSLARCANLRLLHWKSDWVTEESDAFLSCAFDNAQPLRACLQHIDISSWQLGDEGVIALARCSLLERACLDSTAISAEGMRRLVNGCLRLRLLICARICDEAAQQLSRCVSLQWLVLCGSGASWLSDAGLSVLAAGCPAVRSVELGDLSGDSLITDAGITALATGWPQLEHIALNRSVHLSDESIRAFAGHPRLQYLELRGGAFFTNATTQLLAEGFSALKRVKLSGCRRITSDAKAELATARPDLQVGDFVFHPECPCDVEARFDGIETVGPG